MTTREADPERLQMFSFGLFNQLSGAVTSGLVHLGDRLGRPFADSSILAVFEMFNLLWRHQRPFSELVAPLDRYAKSPEINFEVDDKAGAMAACG